VGEGVSVCTWKGDLSESFHSPGRLVGKTMARSADWMFSPQHRGKTRIIVVECPIEMDLMGLLILENPVRD